jgi:hypothetical protein
VITTLLLASTVAVAELLNPSEATVAEVAVTDALRLLYGIVIVPVEPVELSIPEMVTCSTVLPWLIAMESPLALPTSSTVAAAGAATKPAASMETTMTAAKRTALAFLRYVVLSFVIV